MQLLFIIPLISSSTKERKKLVCWKQLSTHILRLFPQESQNPSSPPPVLIGKVRAVLENYQALRKNLKRKADVLEEFLSKQFEFPAIIPFPNEQISHPIS